MTSRMDLLLQAVEYSSGSCSDNDSSSISSAGSIGISLRPSSAKKMTRTSVITHDSLYSNYLAATKTVSSPSLKNKRPSDISLPLKKRMKLGSFHAASFDGSQHSIPTSSSSMFNNKMSESWTTPPPSFQLSPHHIQQQTRHIRSDTSLSTLTRASGFTDSPTLNSEWTAEATATAAATAAKSNNLLLLKTTETRSRPQDVTFSLCNRMIVTTKMKKSQRKSSNKKKSTSSSKLSSSSKSSTSLKNLVKDLNGNDMCMGYFSMSTSSSKVAAPSLSIPTVSSMPSTIITEQPSTTLEGSKNNDPGQQKQQVCLKEVDAYTALLPQVITATKAKAATATDNIASARSMLYQSYLQALENHTLQ